MWADFTLSLPTYIIIYISPHIHYIIYSTENVIKFKKPLIVFDLETTGLDLVKDRIIQLSYIKISPNGNEEREKLLY